ncbi:hypothetical protein HCU64_14395 [Methylobacterium sp. C25]|uniref:hypothetical protein n=1 Tax=Methylobacterium sp. C25 TaxID=2721622 RepID=UPI001F2CE236|nr:hypothetical protein [Methylobacterium sp. C25]MCE4224949.1 hypothetical protein [Methylobacterium sp. C25]
MAFVRTLLLAILAVAVAVAPGAPCTMVKHATADHAAGSARAMTHHDHAAMVAHAGAVQAADTDGGMGPSAHQQHKHHEHKRSGCLATCCPLSCQAAMPAQPWSGAVLSFRQSDPVRMDREDVAVDMHPVRIERPPRPVA